MSLTFLKTFFNYICSCRRFLFLGALNGKASVRPTCQGQFDDNCPLGIPHPLNANRNHSEKRNGYVVGCTKCLGIDAHCERPSFGVMPQTKERWNTAQQNEKMKKPKSSGRFHFCVDFGETKKKELTVKERDGMKKKKREKEEKKKDVNRKRANRRMKEHRAAKVKKERERNEEYYRKKRMQKNGKKMDEWRKKEKAKDVNRSRANRLMQEHRAAVKLKRSASFDT